MGFVGKSVYNTLKAGYSLSDVHWPFVAASAAFGLVGYLLAPLLWIRLLRLFGTPVTHKTGPALLYLTYTRSWLARYIPGNFWNLGGRALLASRLGVPTRPLTLSILMETFFLHVIPVVFGGALLVALLVNITFGGVLMAIGFIAVATSIWLLPQTSRISDSKTWKLPKRLAQLVFKDTPSLGL